MATLLDLVEQADALIEGFRPGVMERLGIGPDECLARNPKLVFGRMTGWGQDGPYALAPATTSTTSRWPARWPTSGGPVRRRSRRSTSSATSAAAACSSPSASCAPCSRPRRAAQGQVVDAAMVDGTATLMSMFWSMSQSGVWDGEHRGTNLLDTGAHFYDAYECSDGSTSRSARSSRSSTPSCCACTGLSDDPQFAKQMDKSEWPALKARLHEVFKGKTRAEWCELMEHTDVCFAPVLTMAEAAEHPHNVGPPDDHRARRREAAGPGPRFSRTTPEIARSPQHPGQGTRDALEDWGIPKDRIDALVEDKAVVAS